MITQAILLSCLLLAASDGAAEEPSYMNTTQIEFPLNIAKERRHEIRDVVLYVSRDEDRPLHWERANSIPLDKTNFKYEAPGDGVYWFVIQTVWKNGKLDPPKIENVQTGLKVVVDLTRPLISLQAERSGDRIVGRWDIVERNPEPETLRLEYQTLEMAQSKQWYPVGVQPAPRGTFEIPNAPPSPVKVRMVLKDKADNVGMKEVPVPGVIQPASNTGSPSGPVPGPTWPGSNLAQKPPAPQPPGGPGGLAPPPPAEPPAPLAVNSSPSPPSQAIPSSPVSSTVTSSGASPAGAAPPFFIVNRPVVKLDFTIKSCGPSGLGTADIYLTSDEGATWRKTQANEPLLGVPAESAVLGPVQAAVMVKIPQQDTVFGIYVDAKNKVGVGRPPGPGTVPQMRVEMDAAAPEAELRLPTLDPNRENVLVFRWTANDKNLDKFPISLEYAEKLEGPWKPIGPPALPNTGRYDWEVTSDVPGLVYLKLTVRDRAGNRCEAVTQKPVVVDPTPPKIGDVHLAPFGQ